MSEIVFDTVSFRYASSPDDVLREVSLEFRAGEISWLFGSLGAGCTTVLLIAAGLAPRHTGGTLHGEVRLLGHAPHMTDAAHSGQIGFVTATPELQLSGIAATVYEEVAFTPANLGWPIERIRSAARQALARLGIDHLADRNPRTLSGGELQRTIIASMAVLEPRIWLLDEPTSSLDHAGRTQAYELFRAEADAGATVLVASEDADELVTMADRVVVLGDGRPVLDAPPRAALAGEAIWREGPGSTSVAGLARAAGLLAASPLLDPPYPLTVEDGLERWQ